MREFMQMVVASFVGCSTALFMLYLVFSYV